MPTSRKPAKRALPNRPKTTKAKAKVRAPPPSGPKTTKPKTNERAPHLSPPVDRPPRPRAPWQPYAPAAFTGRLEQPWRSVLARPADLDARAVLADALTEAGDARGEYLQLALAQAPGPEALERRAELFDRLSPAWRRPLVPADAGLQQNLRGFDFANGLVEHASLQLRTPAVLDWLVERAPIRSLDLSDYEADAKWVDWFPAHRVARQLETLKVSLEKQDVVVPLLRTGAFEGLTTFEVSAPLTPELAEALVTHTPRLRALAVYSHAEAPVDHAITTLLARLPLESLTLNGVSLDARAVARLAGSSTLRRLALRGGALSLAPLAALSQLVALDLTDAAVEARELGALLAALTALEALTLEDVELDAAALKTALRRVSPRLASLSVRSMPARDGLAGALEKLRGLRTLSVAQTGLTQPGLVALSGLDLPVEELDLGLLPFDDRSVAALAAGPLCSRLKVLSLSMSRLGSSGGKLLARAPWLHGLESLRLFSNRMGNTGLRAMLEQMPNVTTLFLGRENAYRDEGLLVATRGLLPRLRTFDADEASADALERFIASGHADDLRSLSVGDVTVTRSTAQALLSLPRLRELHLRWATFEPGVAALLEARWAGVA